MMIGHSTRDRWSWWRGASCLGMCALLLACQSQERVIRYKPFLANIQEAEHHTEIVGADASYRDPTLHQGDLVVKDPDGSTRLILKNVRHVMVHLERLLDEGEDEMLYDQLIATSTKRRFLAQGEGREQILDYLKEHRRDIAVLFSRMPFGTMSPTVITEKTSKRRWKIRLTGAAKRGSNFTELWVEMERGAFKLVWVE